MRLDDVAEFVEKRFSYKPNWNIRVIGGEFFAHDVVGFRFEMNVPDIRDGDRIIPVTGHMDLTVEHLERMDEEELTHHLVGEIRSMEVHEMDEWLAVDRRQIAGPHKIRNYVYRGVAEGVRRSDFSRRDPDRAPLPRRSAGRALFHGPGLSTMLSQTPDFGGSDAWEKVPTGEGGPVSIPVKVRGRWARLLQEARRYLGAPTADGRDQ